MPDPKILFILDAKNLASKEAAKLKKDFQGVGTEATKAGGGIGSWTAALGGSRLVALGVAGAAGAVVLGLKGAAEAAIAEERNIAKLNASLAANIAGWDGNTAAIERRIVEGEKLAFSDDAQRASLALLVGATHDITEAQALQATAMDLARLKGIGLEEASTALIRVESGQYRMLKSLGIVLRDGATQTEALAAVQAVAAGQAKTYASTAGGAIESLGIVFEDLSEDVGELLLPVIKDLAEYARDDLIPAIRDTGRAIGPVVDFIGDMNIGVQDLVASIALWKAGLGPLLPAYLYLEYELKKFNEVQAQTDGGAARLRDQLEHPFRIGPIDFGPLLGFQTEAQKTMAAALETSDAMVALGRTPEAIAADLSEKHAIMAKAAWTGIQQPIEQAVRVAQTHAKAIARATPFEIAKSLREGSDPVKVAAELLKDAIKNSLTPAKEIAALQGQLTGDALQKALHSKRPEVVAAAEAWKAAIEERLFALRNGVPQIALDTGRTYGDALQSKRDEISRQALAALAGARTALKAMETDAATWGTNTGSAYSQGIADGIQAGIKGTGGIVWSIQKIRGIMKADSPPGPESPLHKIDVWGARTGDAWTEGMVGGIDAAAIRRAMAGVGGEQMRGLGSGFGGGASSGARPRGGVDGLAPAIVRMVLPDGRVLAELVDENLYYARAAAAR